MKLKIGHNSAKERIIQLIVSGNILLEQVTNKYFQAKEAGEFVPEKSIPRWQQQNNAWLHECIDVMQGIFPTPLEAIRLRNARGSPVAIEGTNVEWNSILNSIRARLSVLDGVISSLKDYSVEMAEELFVEQIDSFVKAGDINAREVRLLLPLDLTEDHVQTAFEEIIGENFHQRDWGGETNDLFTSHIRVGGKRLRAAFLMKGRGTRGKLTISKCGKNGDQIVRLMEAPAGLYIIQHVDEIDERVISDLEGKVRLRNRTGDRCHMCIIDGTDTARIMKAYGKI